MVGTSNCPAQSRMRRSRNFRHLRYSVERELRMNQYVTGKVLGLHVVLDLDSRMWDEGRTSADREFRQRRGPPARVPAANIIPRLLSTDDSIHPPWCSRMEGGSSGRDHIISDPSQTGRTATRRAAAVHRFCCCVEGRPRGQRSKVDPEAKVYPEVKGRPRGQRSKVKGRPRGQRSKVDPEVKGRPRNGRRSTPRSKVDLGVKGRPRGQRSTLGSKVDDEVKGRPGRKRLIPGSKVDPEVKSRPRNQR
jgi:hypothetical protein